MINIDSSITSKNNGLDTRNVENIELIFCRLLMYETIQ